MKGIAEKLRNLEQELAAEKGPFTYFAYVPNAETPDRWELVVSAPWISADMMQGLRVIAGKLKEHLEPQELLSISRIVPLREDHPFIEASHKLTSDVRGPRGPVELTGTIVNGILIPNMFVFASGGIRIGSSAKVEVVRKGDGVEPKPSGGE
jgi:hypothetical protein